MMAFLLVLAGCKKEEYALPAAKEGLQNDLLKRTLGPNIVGEPLEFAYAIAIKGGAIESAAVTASFEGASGTYMEHRSFFTDAANAGKDSGIVVAAPSVTSHNTTTVTFTKDTAAATLRYYYIIPEEARGKTITFTFSAKSKNGQSVSYSAGPYQVAKMEMVRHLTLTNGDSCYLSISDLKVYSNATVAANAGKVDLIYLQRTTTNNTFNHALVSPAADPEYLPGVTLPAGVNKSTKLRKVFNLQDYHLGKKKDGTFLQWAIFVDDIDFQRLDLSESANFALNLKEQAGVWAETSDGKYRAYIYFNEVNANRTALISIKRYTL